MEKQSLKLPFYAAAIGIYAFGMNAKLLNLSIGIDVYSYLGSFGDAMRDNATRLGGATTLSCLIADVTKNKAIPKLKSIFNKDLKLENKYEEIAAVTTLLGLTAAEVIQATLPKAKFDWPDLIGYTTAILATYAIGKYDQRRNNSVDSIPK